MGAGADGWGEGSADWEASCEGGIVRGGGGLGEERWGGLGGGWRGDLELGVGVGVGAGVVEWRVEGGGRGDGWG